MKARTPITTYLKRLVLPAGLLALAWFMPGCSSSATSYPPSSSPRVQLGVGFYDPYFYRPWYRPGRPFPPPMRPPRPPPHRPPPLRPQPR